MNVFEFRQNLVNEYAEFTRSFTRIKADDIRAHVDAEYVSQKYWPEPLVQVNPNFQPGGTVESLCAAGQLSAQCAEIFRFGTHTAHDMQAWADDLLAACSQADPRAPEQHGSSLPPFPWNPQRCAQLRAELDAYYARLYGLTRDELRYLLDPADVMGADYPSETFRVLKDKELREFGEYRTRRLVLEAWDGLDEGKFKSC